MIKRFEYVMENTFSNQTIYLIEKLDNNYYFSSNEIKDIKIDNEKAIEFIEKLLSSLVLRKKNNNIVILDEPIGYINILKENKEVLTYLSKDYLFGNIEKTLYEFELSIINEEV